jgi:hypothetical protein
VRSLLFIASGKNSTGYNFGYTSEDLPMAVFWFSINVVHWRAI